MDGFPAHDRRLTEVIDKHNALKREEKTVETSRGTLAAAILLWVGAGFCAAGGVLAIGIRDGAAFAAVGLVLAVVFLLAGFATHRRARERAQAEWTRYVVWLEELKRYVRELERR